MATCFVVMGFKTKTDLATGRNLNLDATYQEIIKPAVESCGLKCIRADEIPHSGVIDLPMYEQLLQADLVIADISTANPNALYELGVRHALRQRATIIIAEDKFSYPFDLNHIVIRSYKHRGEDIGATEVRRFVQVLMTAIKAWQAECATEAAKALAPDSPVYTFLKDLKPPCLEVIAAAVESALESAVQSPVALGAAVTRDFSAPDETLAMIIAEGERAMSDSRFQDAKRLFRDALRRCQTSNATAKAGIIANAGDPCLIHRLTLATYKAQQPDKISALCEALELLAPLNPAETNDPETLGLAGAIEKRLFDQGQGIEHLQRAIGYYERGYFLKDDYYNGINLAFLLDVRAGTDADSSATEKIADHVLAGRVRRNILRTCGNAVEELRTKQQALAHLPSNDRKRAAVDDQLYWVLATLAEAYFGLGELDQVRSPSKGGAEPSPVAEWKRLYTEALDEASRLLRPAWMLECTDAQIQKLDGLLKAHEELFWKLA